jgi:hypothetical protein
LAQSFAGKLKAEIEGAAGVPATAAPSVFAAIGNWLRKLWRAILGSNKASD